MAKILRFFTEIRIFTDRMMDTMKKILFLITVLLQAIGGMAQPDCQFSHYSSEDGLSQNTVMSILQDKKGMMWFSTWDGINRFDGYTFKSYKASKKNQLPLINNRVDEMVEDGYGFLWLQTYAEQVYRFNPRTEDFELVPAQDKDGHRAAVEAIKVLPGGSTWLLTRTSGAIRVCTSPDNFSLTSKWYCDGSGEQTEARVFDVLEDANGREWLLTSRGLCMIPAGGGEPVSYLADDGGLTSREASFRAGYDCGAEVLFGAGDGSVWSYRKSGGQFRKLTFMAGARIVSVQGLDEGQALIVTDTNGFFVYNLPDGTSTHYGAERFPSAPLRSAYVDSSLEVWFEQEVEGTVVHFNAHTQVLKKEVVAVEPTSTDRSRPAFHVHEDCQGRTWVHPYGGGFSYFDRESNSLKPFHNKLMSDDWRFSNKIHAAFSDRQGNLWLCTHSKGLEKATFRSSQFKMVTPVPHRYESLSNEVRALCEDRYHNLWVGLKDGKLRVYDNARRERGYLTEGGTISTSGTPLRGNVYFILEDSKYNLWIATKGDGLVKAEPQGSRYKLTRYQHQSSDVYSLSDDDVYCVYEDAQGRIWVATFAGGLNYLTVDKDGKEVFINHRNRLSQYPIALCSKVRYITGDSRGYIWIGTTMGALAVDSSFKRPEEAVFHHFMRRGGDESSGLSNNDVHWIISTGSGELYLATFGGGLNKLMSWDKDDNAVFKAYNVEDGLPSDVLLSIREDSHGNLWMSTENGVSKFVPSSETFENYTDRSLPFAVRFSEAASLCTSMGNVLFGSSNGIFILNPDSIKKSSYTPPIVLSKLLVANKEVLPADSSVLKEALDCTEQLTLSHKEKNIVTIQFAALDYAEPFGIQYAYMLEGFEESWNYVGKQRSATYTNLPKGHYVFKVRSTNADGVWSDNTRTLNIEVLPSFWETPLAYFLYVLLVLLVIVTAVYILFTIYRLKHRVYMEHQMTDMKLRFFTDISHELRTPLTLITGPVEYIMEHTDLPADTREQLKVVERNTKRMLRLINQILDFRKIQNKKMKMQVQRIEVVEFTHRIMENFEALADEHQIEYTFKSDKEKYELWVDADKYEKIVYNLISNAFKYTPNGKQITVSVHETEKTVDVSVSDQGIGIAENRRKSIFLRFENMADRNFFNPSTGIGLSLVKELVDMHKAVITVDSKLGEGSCFTVSFLKGKEHYDAAAEFLQDDSSVGMVTAGAVDEQSVQGGDAALPEEADGNGAKNVMLVVEDNSELRLFLRSIFADDFKVVDAADGVEGYEKALKYLPDIIISDVMMPRKDGIEMTKNLRDDMTTSHIPIVLLTAKTAIESKLAGLDYGADDYITKPFSATYLKARVKNLLSLRLKLQELYRQRLTNTVEVVEGEKKEEEKKENEMSPVDKKFMDKLVALMEKNMDNGELLVDDLVQELAVSRSVFFKKLKTLTGLAPVEFIKEMRINRAAQLIAEGEYSMTQISYMVGINDPRYFSKCFKHKFGMTPTEYREKVLNRK